MTATVLIIATRYDAASHYLYEWACALREDLLTQNHPCLFLDGTNLCNSGILLTDAIDRVDYVVFYGHGSTDAWIALPALGATLATTLVDGSTVNILNRRN